MKKILLAASLALGMNGFSQTISNKISFKKGQKIEVVTETKKTSTMEMMGNSMETVSSSTMTESFDIENADANGTSIEYKVKHFTANLSGMQGDQSFDSEKEKDMKGQLGKIFEKGLKNKYTMTVDPFGKITAVKADDNNPNTNKKDDQDAMMAMVSAQFGFNAGLPKEGDASLFKFFPGKEVVKGESWIDSSSSADQMKKAIYTVRSITDNDIVLDYAEEINTEATKQLMGSEAKIKTISKSTGLIMLDRTTGLLKQKTYTINTNGTMEGQGMSIPLTDKTTITITVKAQ